jgi:hypothetical protein
MAGVCKSDENGLRSCSHECHHHGMHHMTHMLPNGLKHRFGLLGKKLGFGHKKGQHGNWGKALLGDCGSKADGEVCSVPREGTCVPGGKCPIFHGEMVCNPKDAHPPKFVTDMCKGKQEGDDCKNMLMPGKCYTPKYMQDMICKVDMPFLTDLWEAKNFAVKNTADDVDDVVVV